MMRQDEHTRKEQNERNEPTRVVELPTFTLAGISAVTTNADELNGNGKIGKLFEQFHSNNIVSQLKQYQQQPGHFSCYYNYEDNDAGQYEIMVGLHVKETPQDQFPEYINTFTIPSAKYAVFVTEQGPIIEVVQRAWSYIWEWSKQSGYERAFSGDFEYYDQHINPNDGQAEIYIAIR